MQRHVPFLTACALIAALTLSPALAATPQSVPRYDHIFVIVEENHGFTDVIGNPAAPNLNSLASQFGLATNYFGVTHPSEPNYVALLGGSSFGINSDDAYWINTREKPSLISQLDQAGFQLRHPRRMP
jgi:phosphatidylinositol-3-phosphatase